jgi:hypothetical protein
MKILASSFINIIHWTLLHFKTVLRPF